MTLFDRTIRKHGIYLNPAEYTHFVELHLRNWTYTRELEEQAKALSKNGFKEQHLINFIRDVCRWGNYAGIAGRVLKQNNINMIRDNFIAAYNILNSYKPDLREAMQKINKIRNLGTPSFASKHLRFLNPHLCPVLDSIIYNGFKKYSFEGFREYSFSSEGYKNFSEDCLKKALNLQQSQTSNPMKREFGMWFAADVEMAIFEYLRSNSENNSMRKIHCGEITENRKLKTENCL